MRLITFSLRGAGSPRIGVRVARHVLDLAAAAGVAANRPRRAHEGLARRRRPGDETGAQAGCGAHADAQVAAAYSMSARSLPAAIPDADKFLCAGKTPHDLEELKRNDLLTETPQEPTGFIKLNSCLCGQRTSRSPEGIVSLDYEPELVFVIGKRALARRRRRFRPRRGVTILNDLTCRDLRSARSPRARASGPQEHPRLRTPGARDRDDDEIRDPYDLWIPAR